MVPREPRLAARRHRKAVVVLAVSIALALSGLGIESASASTRSRLALSFLSLNPDRSNAVHLDGSTVKGQIYVFVRDSETVDKVDFYLDGRSRTKPPVRTDTEPPFDFAGTAADGTAAPYDTKKLADGSHGIKVVLTWSDGTTSSRRANFTVANGVTTTPTTAPTTTAPAPAATTTAPAPPPTSTAPPTTSAPTATATPPKTCTNGKVITEGSLASYFEPDGSEYLIHNNNWNDDAGGTSTITACNYDSWSITSDVPNHSDMSVQTYPNVHRDYPDVPVSTIQSARFAATGPHCTGCVWNIGFDIWIGDGLSHELMIWTENFGQRPAGNIVGTTTIGGHAYEVWRYGSGDGGTITYLSITPQTSGDMPLSEFFKDLQNRGWNVTTTWQVDYGVEIVDTNGNPERFNFTDFAITD